METQTVEASYKNISSIRQDSNAINHNILLNTITDEKFESVENVVITRKDALP